MPPLLDQAPLVEHDDPVGRADGGEAVRDYQRGPAAGQVGERGVHRALGLRIERAGRLVEQGRHDELLAAGGLYARLHGPS